MGIQIDSYYVMALPIAFVTTVYRCTVVSTGNWFPIYLSCIVIFRPKKCIFTYVYIKFFLSCDHINPLLRTGHSSERMGKF